MSVGCGVTVIVRASTLLCEGGILSISALKVELINSNIFNRGIK